MDIFDWENNKENCPWSVFVFKEIEKEIICCSASPENTHKDKKECEVENCAIWHFFGEN